MTHKVEKLLAISVYKQDDYATALIDANINKILLLDSYDLRHEPVFIDDQDKIGKGHDWATEIQNESWNTELTLEADANSLILPWLLALYFGSNNSTLNQALNERQQVELTGGPDGGTFTLTYSAQTTGNIAFDAAAAVVATALEGLNNIAPGDVTVTGPAGGPWLVNFVQAFAGLDVAQMTGDGALLTGGTDPAVVVTTIWNGGAANQNVFTYSDRVAVASQDPVTSIIEKMGGFRTVKAPSMALDQLTISGELEKRIKLSATLVGSGQLLDDAITPPTGAPAVTSIFTNQMNLLEIGNAGGALTAAGAKWHNWQLALNKNIQRDLGFYPGSGFRTAGNPATGAIRGRAEYGKRRATLNLGLRVLTGSPEYTQLKASTRLHARITCTGAAVPGSSPPVPYSFILDFPNYAYRVVNITEIGDGIQLFNLETLLFYDNTATGDMTATVVTDVDGFLDAEP